MKTNNISLVEEVRYSLFNEDERRVITISCQNDPQEQNGVAIFLADNDNRIALGINDLDQLIDSLGRLKRRLEPYMNKESFMRDKHILQSNGREAWYEKFKQYHNLSSDNKEQVVPDGDQECSVKTGESAPE